MPLTAQSLVTARAGMIYMVEGPATVDGQRVRILNKTTPPQMDPGQVLASPRGHAELLMGQDATLWTGIDAQIRLDETNVDAPRVSLLSGSALLEIKSTRSERSIFIDLGNQTAEIASAGIYRFDRSPDRVRVWSGNATLQGPPGYLSAGQTAEQGRRETFNRRDMDELFYFAASRSLILEAESGRLQRWRLRSDEQYRHKGFNLKFPLPASAARTSYLAASEAGLLYYLEGRLAANDRGSNVPFRVGANLVETTSSRAEIFLGLGIVARLNNRTRFRILDTQPVAPSVVLETGEVLIEIGSAARENHLSVRLGDSVTRLHKPGVYVFDANSASLRVYSGESTTHFGDAVIRTPGKKRLDLRAPRAAASFDAKYQDPFFRWNSRRSLELSASPASFMVDWEPQVSPGRVKHRVFGSQGSLRTGRGTRLPPLLPPRSGTVALPPIDQSPNARGPR